MELDEDYEDTVPSEKGDLFIAINRCLDILESDSSTDSEKSFYLKLLIHFIGDLHQPMHWLMEVSYKMDKEFQVK